MSTSHDLLLSLVAQRLGGDESRLLELFATDEVFELLRAQPMRGDWFHYSPMTFDGEYLVRAADGYEVYSRERGSVSGRRRFATLAEAAAHFYAPLKASPPR